MTRLAVVALATLLVACPEGGSAPKTAFDPNEAFSKANDAFGSTAPPNKPAVRRKGSFAGFNEQFNRHYTDPGYTPAKTIYVSPTGEGSGSSPSSPASPRGDPEGGAGDARRVPARELRGVLRDGELGGRHLRRADRLLCGAKP